MPAQNGYLRPGWIVSRVFNPLVMWLKVTPTLAVRGRRSGEWRQVPVNVLEFEGGRYLVSPRGTTEWVRNMRAAGGGRLETRASAELITATEITNDAKPPIIAAYLARWGSQVRSQFEALPEPDDHPVFRITTA